MATSIEFGVYLLPIAYHCKYCGNSQGKVELSGPHYKLSCANCGKYLQFLSKEHFDSIQAYSAPVHPEDDTSFTECDESPDAERRMLEGINFKLDLIIDHFDIKTKGEQK